MVNIQVIKGVFKGLEGYAYYTLAEYERRIKAEVSLTVGLLGADGEFQAVLLPDEVKRLERLPQWPRKTWPRKR